MQLGAQMTAIRAVRYDDTQAEGLELASGHGSLFCKQNNSVRLTYAENIRRGLLNQFGHVVMPPAFQMAIGSQAPQNAPYHLFRRVHSARRLPCRRAAQAVRRKRFRQYS